MSKKKKNADTQSFREAGIYKPEEQRTGAVGLGMILTALVVGFVVGVVVWGIFLLSTILTNGLWNGCEGLLASAGLSAWWLPLPLCVIGGLIIGLWTKYRGGAPEDLEKVLGEVKQKGGYELEHPGSSVVGFLLPLVFGGSIGPEAGLTGIIAAACTSIGKVLRKAGLKISEAGTSTAVAALSAVFATPLVGVVMLFDTDDDKQPPKKVAFAKGPKIALYLAAAVGACVGVKVVTALLGAESGLPHFDGIDSDLSVLVWFVPCMILGYLGAVVYHGCHLLCKRANAALGDRPVIKPLIAGAVLGTIAMAFPLVLFPGEEQAFELMEDWQTFGAVTLVATGLLKCLTTPLCLNLGWRGGHFFPCIFAGIAMGYGAAVISGVDPMFCVAITTATLVAGIQRKAVVAMVLLLLCFPVKSLVWMAAACVIGAALPYPKEKKKAQQDAPTK